MWSVVLRECSGTNMIRSDLITYPDLNHNLSYLIWSYLVPVWLVWFVTQWYML